MNEEISLIDRALEGTLSPEELRALQDRLKTDPGLRQTYYATLATDQLLDERFGKDARMEKAIRQGRTGWTALDRSPRAVALSFAAAFVLLATILTGLYFLKSRDSPVSFVSTPESHILIDGVPGSSAILNPGQKLSIRQGTVSIKLNPGATAIVTAPAIIRLRDKQGNVDLLSGAAYFEVRAERSNQRIAVHAADRVVRDIGTDFGVVALSPHEGEAYVFSGRVSVSDGEKQVMLDAGNAASWSDQPGVTGIPLHGKNFLTALPDSATLLADDFSEPDGTPIDGKATDTGSPWKVFSGEPLTPSTLVSRGTYDSSYGSRELRADFRYDPPIAGKSNVYVGDFHLLPPTNTKPFAEEADGSARIIFRGVDGAPLLVLSKAIADDNLWRIVDEVTGTASPLLSGTPSRKVALRLVYDSRSGKATLRTVPASSPETAVSLTLRPGLRFRSLSIMNSDGGDLALDSLKIKNVVYPEKIVLR